MKNFKEIERKKNRYEKILKELDECLWVMKTQIKAQDDLVWYFCKKIRKELNEN